jgi:hypothetical protein
MEFSHIQGRGITCSMHCNLYIDNIHCSLLCILRMLLLQGANFIIDECNNTRFDPALLHASRSKLKLRMIRIIIQSQLSHSTSHHQYTRRRWIRIRCCQGTRVRRTVGRTSGTCCQHRAPRRATTGPGLVRCIRRQGGPLVAREVAGAPSASHGGAQGRGLGRLLVRHRDGMRACRETSGAFKFLASKTSGAFLCVACARACASDAPATRHLCYMPCFHPLRGLSPAPRTRQALARECCRGPAGQGSAPAFLLPRANKGGPAFLLPHVNKGGPAFLLSRANKGGPAFLLPHVNKGGPAPSCCPTPRALG